MKGLEMKPIEKPEWTIQIGVSTIHKDHVELKVKVATEEGLDIIDLPDMGVGDTSCLFYNGEDDIDFYEWSERIPYKTKK